MNPPFTLPRRPEAWAEHWLAIWNDPHLFTPNHVIGAVMPHIALTGKSKLVRQVRATLGEPKGVVHTPSQVRPGRTLLAQQYERGHIEACEPGVFAPVGAQISTALIWAWRVFPDE
jgi:hypothetical protein